MPLDKPSPTTIAVVVGVLAVAGGAVAVGLLTPGGQTPPPVGHDASEQYAALDGLSATVVTTVERGGETNRTVREATIRPDDGQVRLRTVDGSAADGTVVVANGSTKWTYDPETNLVSRTDAGTLSERVRTRGERIERLFERAVGPDGTDPASDESTPGVSPLPVMPQGPDTPDAPATNRSGGQVTVSYDGTATVAGRAVHVLQVRPAEGATTNIAQTLWIDAEWFVPLKYETRWVEDGERVTATVEYRDVDFEPGLSGDTFDYEPPENAALVTPNLGENASQRIQRIDGLSATLQRRYDGLNLSDANATEGTTYETVQQVQLVPGSGKQRAEVRRSPSIPGGANNSLLVSNGTVSWLYDSETNNATRLEVDATGRQQQYRRIEQLFARLDRTRTTPEDGDGTIPGPGLTPVPGPGVSGDAPTPTLPAGQFGVSLEGAAQVDGRTTYVLAIRPETDGNESTLGNYSQTLWIDAETFFPVKQRTEFGTAGGRFTVSVTYRNVTVTDGFPAGTFTFEPPADANVTRSDLGSSQSYESPDETVENGPVEVPKPTVPPSFAFSSGRTADSAYVESVTLTYRNETSRLIVSAYATNESALPGNGTETNGTENDTRTGERIRIGDRTGRYTSAGLTRTVSWACGEVRYSVSGRFVSKGLLIEVAASMSCP
ncbi:LolA family protein [Halorientalis pallida]|uniref:Outer membrane lipoprotein carrier protein LolA n=1 Tax=Halorientalis pallida TaxID=2479928 RepID=A0A498KXE8_9EURY|nr:outer membrane lipoprotein carrier protein LolA [Halorientalis pallida]RXK49525.1 outer membrane lipoprotein carrier protein LolA [Halorientalis pallida]